MTKENVLRREEFGNKNVRYLGYNILKSVTYKGEPVVPKILSEVSDPSGKYFNVEQLGGINLDTLSDTKEILLVDKLKVVLVAARQLKEIDNQGIVLFDRDGKNIRVLKYYSDNISMRQVDIEEFYDKKAECLYEDADTSSLTKELNRYLPMGVNLWCEAVSGLAGVLHCSYAVAGEKMPHWIQKYRELNWYAYDIEGGALDFAKNPVLDEFIKELQEQIDCKNK